MNATWHITRKLTNSQRMQYTQLWHRSAQPLSFSLLSLFLVLLPLSAHAAPLVHVVAPQHDPGSQLLRQYLRDRGFQLTNKQPTPRQLLIRVRNGSRVQLAYRNHQRAFQLPKQLHAPHTRARAIVSMVDVFLEEAKQRRVQKALVRRAKKARKPRRLPPKLRRTSRKLAPKRRSKSPRLRRLTTGRPKAVRSSRTIAPKVRRVIPLTRPIPAAKTTPRKKAPARRPSPRRMRPTPPKRRNTPQKSPKKRPKVALLKHTKRIALRPRSPFGMSFGLAGSARWLSHFVPSWGGSATIGMMIWDFTLRLEVSVLTFWLSRQKSTIPLFRPTLWAGWRVPLHRWTDRWELLLLGGVVLDPFVIERVNDARTILHLGLTLGAQASFRLNQRWSLFLRYGFSMFAIGYSPDPEGLDRKAYPAPWQHSAIMGIQFHL